VPLPSSGRFPLPSVPAVGSPHILSLTQKQQGPVKTGRSANLSRVKPRDIAPLWLEHVAGDGGICTVINVSGFPSVFMRVYRIAESEY
jgi:hypothetical protein